MGVLQWLLVFCPRYQELAIDKTDSYREKLSQVVNGCEQNTSVSKKQIMFQICKISNEQFGNVRKKLKTRNSLASCCSLQVRHWQRQEKKTI